MNKKFVLILKEIEELKKSEIKRVIDSRIKEFEELRRKNSHELFKELCFCLLTANFSASGGIKIQNMLQDDFLILPEKKLSEKLKQLGHRFPNTRAKYIIQARNYKNDLKKILDEIKDEFLTREWIVKNIKGLGMKESSHFLRNIGYKKLAIIDFHIIDLLAKYHLIEKPKNKSLTPKKYLEIEKILNEISEFSKLSLGELDLYLWYKETGKVLK